MKIEKNVVFTKEDFELLSKVLPNDPCYKCDARIRGYCCGCQRGADYDKAVKKYKDNNIYEIALEIKEFHDLKKEVKKIKQRQSDILDNLPSEVKNNVSFL